MFGKLVSLSVAGAMLLVCTLADAAQEKDKKKRTGTLVGEIKAQKPTPNGLNVILEVLAPGEEKARSYRVMYDPAAKKPNQTVLEAVKAAKIGDRCQLDWVDTGEGLAITAFQVLKKGDKEEKK